MNNPITDFFDQNMTTIGWFVYLAAAICFIQGLRYMNSPRTARKGNFISITGMSVAVVMAFISAFHSGFANPIAIIALLAGITLGVLGGAISARKVKMTAMPQLVSIFNTVGGGAAALVAINDALSVHKAVTPKGGMIDGTLSTAGLQTWLQSYVGSLMGGGKPGAVTEFFTPSDLALTGKVDHIALFTATLGILIGCITFTGSIIAAGKLQGIVSGAAVKIPAKMAIDFLMLLVAIVSGFLITAGEPSKIVPGNNHVMLFGSEFSYAPWIPVVLLCVAALVLGVTFAMPIGGADMPVVISILNACTGTAVAMAGFVINNLIMIVAGALVGASGAILSQLMAKAMNRSLLNILAGGFGGDDAASGDASGDVQVTKETSADDLAVQMAYASMVIIVPGYGLAVAGAQHEIAELTNILEDKGVEVLFAIHPVAGRMPGHMNVLLAEANISYDKLLDLDDVNPQFSQADVALVVGANDVTNPAARRQGTPISGMPILDVDYAKNVVVVKRGRGKGYAGIENELYGLPQTSMLYGDAKKVAADVILAVKEL
jgi:NAD(P) transhydrogenase subunit beta